MIVGGYSNHELVKILNLVVSIIKNKNDLMVFFVFAATEYNSLRHFEKRGVIRDKTSDLRQKVIML